MLRERSLGVLEWQLLPNSEGARQSRTNNLQSVVAHLPVSKPINQEETMLTRTKIVCFVSLFALSIIPNFGCSVFMAAQQPNEKNVDLFKVGTSRSMLLAEFGTPTVSEVRNEKKSEIFKFVQGYSSAVKAGRAFFHGAADVVTWGLWEVVGTPTEAVFRGNEMAYEVTYDDKDRIDQVTALKKE
jgi:hypothetical protein